MTEIERQRNREYQRKWRAKHFTFHAHLCQLVSELGNAPDLLDALNNPDLAKAFREAAKILGDKL